MDDLTNTAVWFVMALLVMNIIFAWLTLTGGPFALKVSPTSPLADLQACSNTIQSGHNGASALGVDVQNSYTCGVSPIIALVGGWQIALQNVFSGGVFNVPLNPSEPNSTLGYLYTTFLMPVFIILQALAILDIAYRVAIALSSVGSALLSAGSSIANGIFSIIGGFLP